MSGSYGIWTSPVRAEATKVSFEDMRQISVPAGTAGLSISIKTSLRTGRHFKSKSKKGRNKRRPRPGLDVPRELLTLSQRGVDTSGSALDLDPRTDDGSPVVPRAFTQTLNTRPYTKDQRLAQLRGLIVSQNPGTLHQPESFHVHSFFESAAPGMRVNSASTNQLRAPHARPINMEGARSWGDEDGEESNDEKQGEGQQLNQQSDQQLNQQSDQQQRKQRRSRQTPTLSQIYEQHTEDMKKTKSLGAEWPIGPKVDDRRLQTHYQARRLRKTAVPLAPLDPPLPSVDEMPPVPNDSFFMVHNTNKLRPTRGFETTIGGANRRPNRKRKKNKKKKKKHSKQHQQQQQQQQQMSMASSSVGSIAFDVTLAAPLMATRRLFGKVEVGEDDMIEEEELSMVGSPPSGFNESVEQLHFGDEQEVTPKRKRPSTAPTLINAESVGRNNLPGSMRMTVVVREKDRGKGKRNGKSGKRREKMNRDRTQSESRKEEDEDVFAQQEQKTPSPFKEKRTQSLDTTEIYGKEERLHGAWITIPVVVLCTEDVNDVRIHIMNQVLPALNLALALRRVRLVLLDVQTELTNTSDVLTSVELSTHYTIVIRGKKYSAAFDQQARHALKISAESEAKRRTLNGDGGRNGNGGNVGGGGAMCLLQANDPAPKSHEKKTKRDTVEKETALDSFFRSVDGLCTVQTFQNNEDVAKIITGSWLARLEEEYYILHANTSWIEIERSKHAAFRKKHVGHGRGVPGLLEGVAESVKLNVGMSPVVVLGSQGSGKSHSMAVLSDFIEDAGEGFCAIAHYVDASTESRKLCPVLARLATELRSLTNARNAHHNADSNENQIDEASFLDGLRCQNYPRLCSVFGTEFRRCASTLAAFGKTLVLLVDGVDQLEVDRLEWLPVLIPANAQLVLSSSPSSSALRSLWYRYGQLQTFDLDANPMPNSQLEETLRDATTQWEVFGIRKSASRPESPTKHSIIKRHRGSNLEFIHCLAWRLHRENKMLTRKERKEKEEHAMPRTTQGLLEEEVHHADVDLREFFVRHVRDCINTSDGAAAVAAAKTQQAVLAAAKLSSGKKNSESKNSDTSNNNTTTNENKGLLLSLEQWVTASVELFASLSSALWVTRTEMSFQCFENLIHHLLCTTWKLRNVIPLGHILRPNPTLIASRIISSLGPHLGAGRKDDRLCCLGWSTTSMRDCVGNMFLKTPVLRARAQGIMAAFSMDSGDPLADGTWRQHQDTKTDEVLLLETEHRAWSDAVSNVVEYQLSGHEVLGLRATLCNPWYLRARCVAGIHTPTGIDSLLTDFQRALECLADPLYVSLHCNIYGTPMSDIDQKLCSMSDALTELYQFVLYRQSELSRAPEDLTLQLALLEWMTRLPCELVEREKYGRSLFSWKNKPKRPARLTAHVGYNSVITACAVSRPVRFLSGGVGDFGSCCFVVLSILTLSLSILTLSLCTFY